VLFIAAASRKLKDAALSIFDEVEKSQRDAVGQSAGILMPNDAKSGVSAERIQ
jgi:hypothetical protein